MKNTFKRIAAIALAVLMCVSAMVPAFAAETNACPGTARVHTAANCDYTEVSKQAASCEVPGFVTGKCKTCGVVFTVSQTDALGHDFGEVVPATCDNESTKMCKICDYKEVLSPAVKHLYTAWTTTDLDGKCVEGNKVEKTCVYCGDVVEKEVGPDGHYFVLVSYIEPADCVTEGKANVKCVICGTEKTEKIVNDGAHDYVAWSTDVDDITDADQKALFKRLAEGKKDKNATDATCIVKGTHSEICLNCGDVKVVVDGFDDHNLKAPVERKAPDCEKVGNEAYVECTECDQFFRYTIEDEEVVLGEKYEGGKAETVIPAIHDNYPLYNDEDSEYPLESLKITYERGPKDGTAGLRRYGCPKCSVELVDGKWTNKTDGTYKNVEVEIPAFGGHVYLNTITDAQKLQLLATLDKKTVEEYEKELADSDDTLKDRWEAKFYFSAKVAEQKNHIILDGKGAFANYDPATCTDPASVKWLCLNYYVDMDGDIAYGCASKTEPKATILSGEGFDATGHDYNYSYKYFDDVDGDGKNDKAPVEEAPTCYDDGLVEYVCKNCNETTQKGIPSTGHDYKVLTAEDIKNGEYYVDGKLLVIGEAEDEEVSFEAVTCVTKGYKYSYCLNGCEDKDGKKVVALVESVKADGETHNYTYRDFKYDGKTYTVDSTKYDADDADDVLNAYEFLANLECEVSVTVQRKCTNEDCDANGWEKVTVKGPEHTYIDVEDEKVIALFKDLDEDENIEISLNDIDPTADDIKVAELNEAGTCEDVAELTLYCVNGCGMDKYYDFKGDFAKGHVKTYLEGTAVAPVHGEKNGHSNNWYCSNELCEYYWGLELDTNEDGKADAAELANSTSKEFGSDTKYDFGHMIWDAKKEEFVEVSYEHVPDANVSGAASLAEARKVKAPVDANGNVVRYVVIPGTTLVWVYAYDEDVNHTELQKVDKGGFVCVDCDEFDPENVKEAVQIEVTKGNDAHTYEEWDSYIFEADCVTMGRTTMVCTGCFDSYQTEWTKANGHSFTMLVDDGTKMKDEADIEDFDDIKDGKVSGLTYVAPTCTRAGYAIDKCTEDDCGLVVVVALKALGHRSGGRVVEDTCLDTAEGTRCDVCNHKFDFSHKFDDAGVCTECGETK